MDGVAKKRTRLTPEARREKILDAAKELILKDGLQQFSFKKLAVKATVSEPLLFHYFTSGTELLQQLLERDYTRFFEFLNAALDGATTLEEILHIYASSDYDQLVEGKLIDILLTNPDVACVIKDQVSLNIKTREKWLVDKISAELGITRRQAAMVATMGSAASLAAANFSSTFYVSREEVIRTVTQFVAAGFDSVRKD